jgi:two-component system, NarL family, response regulator LiaR
MADLIRVLIVDDHIVVREGLRAFIGTQAGIEIIGEAENGFQAVELTALLKPDVVLMDLVMAGMDGIQATQKIKQDNPAARILVLTSFADDDKVFPAIKAGALGYLLKDSTPQQLLQAIQDVYHGVSSLHPLVANKLIRELNRPPDLPPTREPLTARELAVLELLAQGLSNTIIAEKLTLSEWTVRTHISNILSKLHLANRTQAALYALREGLTGSDGETIKH